MASSRCWVSLALTALVVLTMGTLRPGLPEGTAAPTAGAIALPFVPGSFVVQDLGTLGGPISIPNSINNYGVVGGFSTLADGRFLGFVYNEAPMLNIGTLTGFRNSAVADINDDNVVVANASSGANNLASGFLFMIKDRTLSAPLPLASPFGAGRSTFVSSISDIIDGTARAVGNAQNAAGIPIPIEWVISFTGATTVQARPLATSLGGARSISELLGGDPNNVLFQIVGSQGTLGQEQAFSTVGGPIMALGSAPGFTRSILNANNSFGEGAGAVATAAGQFTAARRVNEKWVVDGGPTASPYSEHEGINGLGDAVGVYGQNQSAISGGFVTTLAGVKTDLSALVRAGSAVKQVVGGLGLSDGRCIAAVGDVGRQPHAIRMHPFSNMLTGDQIKTPDDALAQLLTKVEESTISRKSKRPLVATLKAAQASLDRQNHGPVVNQLETFKRKVNLAMQSGALPADQGQSLLEMADSTVKDLRQLAGVQ